MKNIFPKKLLAGVFILTFGIVACKSSSETIVITDAPTSSGRADSTMPQPNNTFQQLSLGEITPLRSLDPLFADNLAGLHAAQLLYEGLVQYDKNGDIAPAIAKKWTVSNNDQTYRFTLNSDIFYHDSDIFSNGLGRKLTARDVQYVFERMAKANVPDRAARLFMNIDGFEPYYQEQHQVLRPEDRQLKNISGIKVPNDSTITFSLVEPDPQFINKLATPWASIYPREAVTANGFKAVGTGPFKLSQMRSDSLYIFARFENYRLEDQPKLNRVDIRTYTEPTSLINALNQDDVQLIPRLGPQHMIMLLNSNGRLKESVAQNAKIYKADSKLTYFIRYHDGADLSRNEVIAMLQRVNQNQLFPGLPASSFGVLWPQVSTSTVSSADSLTATFSADPFITAFYDQLGKQLANKGIGFSMSTSRAVNRNTPLFPNAYFPAYATQKTSSSAMITLTFKTPGISRTEVQNVTFNNLPWWIDLRQTTVPLNENR